MQNSLPCVGSNTSAALAEWELNVLHGNRGRPQLETLSTSAGRGHGPQHPQSLSICSPRAQREILPIRGASSLLPPRLLLPPLLLFSASSASVRALKNGG